MGNLVRRPWRSVYAGDLVRLAPDAQLVAVGEWLEPEPSDVLRPGCLLRRIGAMRVQVDPAAEVEVFEPDLGEAIKNLIRGGFDIRP